MIQKLEKPVSGMRPEGAKHLEFESPASLTILYKEDKIYE